MAMNPESAKSSSARFSPAEAAAAATGFSTVARGMLRPSAQLVRSVSSESGSAPVTAPIAQAGPVPLTFLQRHHDCRQVPHKTNITGFCFAAAAFARRFVRAVAGAGAGAWRPTYAR